MASTDGVLYVSLGEKLKRALTITSARTGKTISQLVREAVATQILTLANAPEAKATDKDYKAEIMRLSREHPQGGRIGTIRS